MSLILRKNCQSRLNAIGLTSFYVDIDDAKNMVVKTKCGKLFFVVKGVSFSRKTPTKAEIEYAAELFTAYLIENKEVIEEYIDLYIEVNNLEDVPVTNENGIRISALCQWSGYRYSYDDGIYSLMINGGVVTSLSLANSKSATFNELIAFELNIPLFNAHAQYFRQFEEVHTKRKELYDLASKMNTCDL